MSLFFSFSFFIISAVLFLTMIFFRAWEIKVGRFTKKDLSFRPEFSFRGDLVFQSVRSFLADKLSFLRQFASSRWRGVFFRATSKLKDFYLRLIKLFEEKNKETEADVSQFLQTMRDHKEKLLQDKSIAVSKKKYARFLGQTSFQERL